LFEQITLVLRQDILSLNEVLKTGLGSTNAIWKTAVADSLTGQINFPYTHGALIYSNFFAHGTALSTIPFTFSYMW
jgi:hypothetical protein